MKNYDLIKNYVQYKFNHLCSELSISYDPFHKNYIEDMVFEVMKTDEDIDKIIKETIKKLI